MLDDIERIEVIRGPGGTLWGSNAVNGIVSIVMKEARETQGPLVAAAVGSEELGEVFQEATPPRTIYPVSSQNGIDGTTFGFEVTADVRPLSRWRWIATYSLLRAEKTPEPGSTDITQESRYGGGSPRHQLRMRNSLDLPGGVSLDWHLRCVSELPDIDIPEYATSDVRLSMASDLRPRARGGRAEPARRTSSRVAGRERGGQRGDRAEPLRRVHLATLRSDCGIELGLLDHR